MDFELADEFVPNGKYRFTYRERGKKGEVKEEVIQIVDNPLNACAMLLEGVANLEFGQEMLIEALPKISH